VENGAHINDQDAAGRTPLHYAAETGKSRCIPFLLQKGASVDIRDKHGKTAIDLAASDKITKIITAYCEGRGMVF
jgi:ankyrin repeat protein